MRQLIQIAVGLAIGLAPLARADSFPMVVSGVSSGATVVVTNKQPVTGFVESLTISASSSVTGTVTVAGRDEPILSAFTLPTAGGTTNVRPMVVACNTAGTLFATNMTVRRVYLSDECPVLTGVGGNITASASGSITVLFKLSRE